MYVDDSIHIEKTDQCYTCEYFMKSVMCPLLEALALSIVELTGDVTVQNCGFYRQYTRHLRVVENAAKSGSEEESARKDDNEDESSSQKSRLQS